MTKRSGDLPAKGDLLLEYQKQTVLKPHNFAQELRLAATHPSTAHNSTLIESIKTGLQDDPLTKQTLQDLKDSTTTSREVALGLCDLQQGLLIYDSLIWIPDSTPLKLEIMKHAHDALTAGHPGREKTLQLLTGNYYWPGMRKFVTRYANQCDIKSIRHAPFRPLKLLQVPHCPWRSNSMDFITGLPESQGFDTIWVVVDCLTEISHFLPCNISTTAQGFAKLFMTHVFRLHGLPDEIISNRDFLFTADL